MKRPVSIALGMAALIAVLMILYIRRETPLHVDQPHLESGPAAVPFKETEKPPPTEEPAEAPPGPGGTPSPASAPSTAMTPQLAAEELAKAQTIGNLSMKQIRCGNILFQLANAGYLDEAWDLLDAEPGALRDHEMSRIMEAENVPVASRLQLINRLRDERDQRASLKGFFSSMDGDEILAIDGSLQARITTPELHKKFAVACATRISRNLVFLRETRMEGHLDKKKALMRRVAEMASRQEITAAEVQRVYAEDEDGSSFAKWNLVSGINFPETDTKAGELRRNIVSSMVMADSGKAMEVLAQQPGSPALGDGIDSWYQQDPGGANRWLQSTGLNLPPAQRDQVLAAVVKISMKDKDLDTAKAWAAEISDPALRAGLLQPASP